MAAPPSPSGADTASVAARVADEAIGLLRGGATGVLLFGGLARAPVPRILDRVRALPLAPVRFEAADGTIEGLRAEAERVHTALPDASTPLLLVVDDADRLGAALLRELEQAAAAAAELGGLKFLFVVPNERGQDLADGMRRQALPALARCMETGLRCARAAVAPDAGERPYRRPDAPAALEAAPPPARLPRVLVAGAILALLAVVLAVGISHLSEPRVTPLSVPPPLNRAPPLILPAPTQPAPPQPAVAVPAPAVPVAPAPVPQAPVMPAPAPVPTAPVPMPVPPRPAAASLLLIARPGDTLASLYAQVYRGTTPPPFGQVAALNPAVIGVGTRLVFPAPATGWSPAR